VLWNHIAVDHYERLVLARSRRTSTPSCTFGVEDWVSDSALFALVTMAFHEPEHRDEVRRLVRAQLDAAVCSGLHPLRNHLHSRCWSRRAAPRKTEASRRLRIS
jgi:hypothetical protein